MYLQRSHLFRQDNECTADLLYFVLIRYDMTILKMCKVLTLVRLSHPLAASKCMLANEEIMMGRR